MERLFGSNEKLRIEFTAIFNEFDPEKRLRKAAAFDYLACCKAKIVNISPRLGIGNGTRAHVSWLVFFNSIWVNYITDSSMKSVGIPWRRLYAVAEKYGASSLLCDGAFSYNSFINCVAIDRNISSRLLILRTLLYLGFLQLNFPLKELDVNPMTHMACLPRKLKSDVRYTIGDTEGCSPSVGAFVLGCFLTERNIWIPNDNPRRAFRRFSYKELIEFGKRMISASDSPEYQYFAFIVNEIEKLHVGNPNIVYPIQVISVDMSRGVWVHGGLKTGKDPVRICKLTKQEFTLLKEIAMKKNVMPSNILNAVGSASKDSNTSHRLRHRLENKLKTAGLSNVIESVKTGKSVRYRVSRYSDVLFRRRSVL